MKTTTQCPICKTSINVEAKNFPFCSPKCQYVDLGLWMNEEYRLRAPVTERNIDQAALAQRSDD